MNNDLEPCVSFMKDLEKFIFRMNTEWEGIIKAYDLTISSFPFFDYISNNPGVTQKEMADAFSVDKAISSRACKYLETKNLIERKNDNRYSHGYGCYLTEKGEDVYKRIIKEGNEGLSKIFSGVSTTDLEKVRNLIVQLNENLWKEGERK